MQSEYGSNTHQQRAGKAQKGSNKMETTEKLTALLSTECQCFDEDSSPHYCDGCGDWMQEGTLELFSYWLERNGDPQRVRCNGRAMGWQRLDGYAIIESEAYHYHATRKPMPRKLLEALTLNGDFTIHYTLEGNALTAIRYSHDEPTGARFEFIAEEEEATE